MASTAGSWSHRPLTGQPDVDPAPSRSEDLAVVVLRRATPEDAPVIARIYIESWNKGFGHLMGLRKLSQDVVDRWALDLRSGAAEWIVAERDDAIVGFVGVCPSRDPADPELGEVNTIAVDPTTWESGVGRTLMDEAVRVLRERFKAAVVWTPADYERGHGFYRATGWAPLGSSRAGGQEVAFGRSFS